MCINGVTLRATLFRSSLRAPKGRSNPDFRLLRPPRFARGPRNDELIDAPHNDGGRRSGFTFIEIMITLAVIGVLFVPMMQLFSRGLYSAVVSGDMISAVNLCRWEMERVKNANLTKFQIKKEGDIWIPKLDDPPLEMNNAKWRILRSVNQDSNPVEVTVEAFLADNLNKSIASVTTLIEDEIWVELM